MITYRVTFKDAGGYSTAVAVNSLDRALVGTRVYEVAAMKASGIVITDATNSGQPLPLGNPPGIPFTPTAGLQALYVSANRNPKFPYVVGVAFKGVGGGWFNCDLRQSPTNTTAFVMASFPCPAIESGFTDANFTYLACGAKWTILTNDDPYNLVLVNSTNTGATGIAATKKKVYTAQLVVRSYDVGTPSSPNSELTINPPLPGSLAVGVVANDVKVIFSTRVPGSIVAADAATGSIQDIYTASTKSPLFMRLLGNRMLYFADVLMQALDTFTGLKFAGGFPLSGQTNDFRVFGRYIAVGTGNLGRGRVQFIERSTVNMVPTTPMQPGWEVKSVTMSRDGTVTVIVGSGKLEVWSTFNIKTALFQGKCDFPADFRNTMDAILDKDSKFTDMTDGKVVRRFAVEDLQHPREVGNFSIAGLITAANGNGLTQIATSHNITATALGRAGLIAFDMNNIQANYNLTTMFVIKDVSGVPLNAIDVKILVPDTGPLIYFYVIDSTSSLLKIISYDTITGTIALSGSCVLQAPWATIPARPFAIELFTDFVVVTTDQGALTISSDPTNPQIIGSYPPSATADPGFVPTTIAGIETDRGTFGYLGDAGQTQTVVLHLSDPTAPDYAGSIATPGSITAVAVGGKPDGVPNVAVANGLNVPLYTNTVPLRAPNLPTATKKCRQNEVRTLYLEDFPGLASSESPLEDLSVVLATIEGGFIQRSDKPGQPVDGGIIPASALPANAEAEAANPGAIVYQLVTKLNPDGSFTPFAATWRANDKSGSDPVPQVAVAMTTNSAADQQSAPALRIGVGGIPLPQGGQTTLTLDMVAPTFGDGTVDMNARFIVGNGVNGASAPVNCWYALASSPQTPIYEFTPIQVKKAQVLQVHDNRGVGTHNLPSSNLAVAAGNPVPGSTVAALTSGFTAFDNTNHMTYTQVNRAPTITAAELHTTAGSGPQVLTDADYACEDPDGDPLTYSWRNVEGATYSPDLVSKADYKAGDATFIPNPQTVVPLPTITPSSIFVCSDGKEAVSKQTLVVHTPVKRNPVVVAGTLTGAVGTRRTFIGTAYADGTSDDDIIWEVPPNDCVRMEHSDGVAIDSFNNKLQLAGGIFYTPLQSGDCHVPMFLRDISTNRTALMNTTIPNAESFTGLLSAMVEFAANFDPGPPTFIEAQRNNLIGIGLTTACCVLRFGASKCVDSRIEDHMNAYWAALQVKESQAQMKADSDKRSPKPPKQMHHRPTVDAAFRIFINTYHTKIFGIRFQETTMAYLGAIHYIVEEIAKRYKQKAKTVEWTEEQGRVWGNALVTYMEEQLGYSRKILSLTYLLPWIICCLRTVSPDELKTLKTKEPVGTTPRELAQGIYKRYHGDADKAAMLTKASGTLRAGHGRTGSTANSVVGSVNESTGDSGLVANLANILAAGLRTIGFQEADRDTKDTSKNGAASTAPLLGSPSVKSEGDTTTADMKTPANGGGKDDDSPDHKAAAAAANTTGSSTGSGGTLRRRPGAAGAGGEEITVAITYNGASVARLVAHHSTIMTGDADGLKRRGTGATATASPPGSPVNAAAAASSTPATPVKKGGGREGGVELGAVTIAIPPNTEGTLVTNSSGIGGTELPPPLQLDSAAAAPAPRASFS